MSIISEKAYAEQSVSTTISAFYRSMKLGAAWRQANGSKQKGIPFHTIFLYLLQLVYNGKSMFEDLRSEHPMAFCRKNTVYRLLNTTSVNWMTVSSVHCQPGDPVYQWSDFKRTKNSLRSG